MELKFCVKILQNENMDAAYVEVPYGKVDEELIKRIALWCYETGNHA